MFAYKISGMSGCNQWKIEKREEAVTEWDWDTSWWT